MTAKLHIAWVTVIQRLYPTWICLNDRCSRYVAVRRENVQVWGSLCLTGISAPDTRLCFSSRAGERPSFCVWITPSGSAACAVQRDERQRLKGRQGKMFHAIGTLHGGNSNISSTSKILIASVVLKRFLCLSERIAIEFPHHSSVI